MQRYAIKHGGMIYVATTVGAVVEAAEAEHGAFRYFGEVIPDGWQESVERVAEDILDLLRDDYTVREIK